MEEKILDALKKETGEEKIKIEVPEREQHGDFATNLALLIAKKKDKNPKKVAEDLVKKLRKDSQLSKFVAKIEVAGPGFINFFLSKEAYLGVVNEIVKKGDEYGQSDLGKGKTVVVDYSSPNIAKRFSIGHLRSTIIGQALYNLYSFLGYNLVGDNHLGDWGTQFGMILAQIKRKDLDVKDLTVDDLEKLYVEFNEEMKQSPKLRQEAKKWFKKLEEKDEEARYIWKKTVDISLSEFEKIYKMLGVKIDNVYGESFYQDKMEDVIEEAREKGISTKSKGAEIITFENMPPAMLVKSDKTTTYLTRDLATIKFRIEKWNPKIMIYEVGSEQKLHFRQVFKAAELLGWRKGREFVHVPHGLIRFEHGKMSTRRGETVKLLDVLDESIERAREIIENSETGRGLSKKEKGDVARKVGIGAIKYFDLMHQPQSDIIFNWDDIFLLEGKSAPYIQYTYARTKSVLRKAEKGIKEGLEKSDNLNEKERYVARSLSQFSGVIVDASKNYSPNLLANYLFDLAKTFNTFYNSERIINSENEKMRLYLTKSVSQVIRNGLNLLGIEAPEKM